MGGGARVSHAYLVGQPASHTSSARKNKPRWTNTAEVPCPGKGMASEGPRSHTRQSAEALPQGARVKCWGYAIGSGGTALKVYGPEGVTKGRVIAHAKSIIESFKTDDEVRAAQRARAAPASSEMSGTIEVVVVNRKDMRRHTEKKAAEMIARVLILNLNRIRLSKALAKPWSRVSRMISWRLWLSGLVRQRLRGVPTRTPTGVEMTGPQRLRSSVALVSATSRRRDVPDGPTWPHGVRRHPRFHKASLKE